MEKEYTKPMVTIELQEYLDLQESQKKMQPIEVLSLGDDIELMFEQSLAPMRYNVRQKDMSGHDAVYTLTGLNQMPLKIKVKRK